MHVRVRGRHRFLETLDIFPKSGQIRALLGAQLSLKSPSPEYKESWAELLHHSREHWIVKVPRKDVHPEISSLQGHRFGLYATARAEVIVSNEFVRLEQRLFLLSAGE